MESVKTEDLQETYGILMDAYNLWLGKGGSGLSGWHSLLLLLPLVSMSFVKVFKGGLVQGALELYFPKLAWANLPLKWQLLQSFVLGAAPVFLGGLFAQPVLSALVLAVAAGAGAVLGWKPAKAVLQSELGAAVLSKLPSAATKTIGVALPVDEARLQLLRDLKRDGQAK